MKDERWKQHQDKLENELLKNVLGKVGAAEIAKAKAEIYAKEPQYCKTCGEVTVFWKGDYEHTRFCACERKERERRRLAKYKNLSINDRQSGSNVFAQAEPDSKEEALLYQECQTYCENYKDMMAENNGLLFFGDPGNGKTFLANCICNELEESGFTVLSFSMAGYLRTLKDNFAAETAFLEAVKSVDMLFIDDLGSEQASSVWAKEKIHSLLDTRYRAGKPLMITTNLGPAALEGFLLFNQSNKIFDRLKEEVEFVLFSWTSKRSRKRKRFLEKCV